MSDAGFFTKLVDSNDHSVESHVVFTGVAIVVMCLCGFIAVCVNAKEFIDNIGQFGWALGGAIGVGGGAPAIAQGWQSRLTNQGAPPQ